MKKNLLLLVGTSIVVFLLAEGAARWLFPQWAPRAARLTQFWRYDARYGWSNIPGAKGVFPLFGNDTYVTMNERGFRGPLVPYSNTPGKRRIEFIGDSYAWGYGVNQNEMFTDRLQQSMADAEIVNLSVTGYSTDQELLLYQDEGYRYHADYVVLVFCMNDFSGNVSQVQYATYEKPIFTLENGQLRLLNQPVQRTGIAKRAAVALVSNSYLANTAYRLLAQARVEDNPELRQTAPDSTFPSSPAERLTARLLLEFKQAVVEKQPGTKFLVVLVDDMLPKYAHQVADYLARLNIQSLVLNDHLDHADKALHLPDENHWSVRGNEVVAESIAAFIQDQR